MKYALVVLALVVCAQANSLFGHKRSNGVFYAAKCPEPTGQFPHETYCEQYINCWEGRGIVQKCGPGMEFDATKKVCGFCEEVDCGSRIKQNPCV